MRQTGRREWRARRIFGDLSSAFPPGPNLSGRTYVPLLPTSSACKFVSGRDVLSPRYRAMPKVALGRKHAGTMNRVYDFWQNAKNPVEYRYYRWLNNVHGRRRFARVSYLGTCHMNRARKNHGNTVNLLNLSTGVRRIPVFKR